MPLKGVLISEHLSLKNNQQNVIYVAGIYLTPIEDLNTIKKIVTKDNQHTTVQEKQMATSVQERTLNQVL